MFNVKKTALILFALTIRFVALAQEAAMQTEDKKGFMRSDGKIYVVVAIALTILAGLILYVMRLDRKITKFEKGDNH
jgi:multisubunit Na+/H+ antiporter MnhB subunit